MPAYRSAFPWLTLKIAFTAGSPKSSYGAKFKIFAPRFGLNEINELSGAEFRCRKVGLPPQSGSSPGVLYSAAAKAGSRSTSATAAR
ncbi:MAG TPA: hypothetical protein VMS87_01780, partial [Roseiarcus sp.]|nr:hypothetical protein [Roseiarcus sp.]